MKLFKDLYNYRELLKSNVKKEIRGKYKGSFLGVLWSFVNPLLSVLIYAIIFPYILRQQQDNYLIFLIVAMIPWNFFVTVVNQGIITIRTNADIIKKVYFPREILPISVAISGLVNFFISCTIILVFVIFSGIGIGWSLLMLPVVAIVQFMLVLGLIYILGAINVYIKDIEYIVNFFVSMLFYATPILYSTSMFPEKIRWVLKLNPMGYLVDAYRAIFYYKEIPNLTDLGIITLFSFLIMIIGQKVFSKLQKGFAEEV